MTTTIIHLRHAAFGLVAAAAFAAAPFAADAAPLPDFYKPWTAVGATGIVDEGTDYANVAFTSGWASINTSVASAVVELRYNVTAQDGLVTTGYDGYRFEARLKDSGTGARVYLQLMDYDLRTGTITPRMTIDSDAYAGSPNFAVRSAVTCWPSWSFDFMNHAYYVDVVLTKSAADALPVISGMILSSTLC